MAFDSQTRNKLQRMVGACRRLLTDEFDDQLQGLYGIYAQDGRALDLEKLTILDDGDYQIATLLRDRVKHLTSGMASEKQPLAEAVRRVLREQAFTVLNRFAALRMAEERGFVQECVGQGLKSKGFQVFETVARSGLGGAYERYVSFIHGMFDELSLDLGVLFDRWSPFGLLFPREPALLKFFDLLNDPELKPLWKEDETIGWIYQYFNDDAERKKMREESAAPRNSRELAVRNQFFTPRYVVEFLTDNTLGRIWYEMTQGQTRLKDQCRYLVRRSDEVFLGHLSHADLGKSEPGVLAMAERLQDGTEATFSPFTPPQNQALLDLGHTVNGYIRHQMDEEGYAWFQSICRRAGDPQMLRELSSQELLDALFLQCRGARHDGHSDAYWIPEIWMIANEIRRRVLESREANVAQSQLLRQVFFVPHRPIKDPRTILMLDPACGSMHFGLYAFDLFEVIYEEAWELEKRGVEFQSRRPGMLSLKETYGTKEDFLKDMPRLIIEHNLHGIDIDSRCAQIAGLSLWLRAHKAWQRLGLKPAERPVIKRSNIVCAEPMPGEEELLREFVEREFPVEERAVCLRLLETIFDKMQLAGEAGSLLKIEEEIRSAIEDARRQWQTARQRPEFFEAVQLASLDKRARVQQELPAPERASIAADLRSLTSEDFWERVEERIYTALRDYAEHAENDGGFQRRLFAEDAVRGFAFIDVCRKRYDVVLMNPPFGQTIRHYSSWLQTAYPDGYVDALACFIERGFTFSTGKLGAITSRSILISKKLLRLRSCRFVPRLESLMDLGSPVMDSAMVQSCAYILDAGRTLTTHDFFFTTDRKLLEDKDGIVPAPLSLGPSDYISDRLDIEQLPAAKLLYSLPTGVIRLLRHGKPLKDRVLIARLGMKSFNDARFLRLRWEIPPDAIGQNRLWEPLSKGGGYAQFYSDFPIYIRWEGTGESIAQENIRVNGQTAQARQASVFYRRCGGTYAYRAKDFGVRVLPAGCIISGKGAAIFPSVDYTASFVIGLLNSRFMNCLMHMQANAKQFDSGIVESLPWQDMSTLAVREITEITK